MNSRNKIIIISIGISFVLGWYLFIKESDYTISFKVKTATGTVFQGIQEWTTERAKSNNEIYTILEKRNFNFLRQEMKDDITKMEYRWEIKPENDSITKVIVGIKDLKNSIYNRLTTPLYNTYFKKEQVLKIIDLRNGLEKHLENFKVKIVGEGKSEETFVAYLSLKSVLQEKARIMISNDDIITGYLHQNNIKIVGRPYVEVLDWNLDEETLDYNYCFPIEKSTKYIEHELIKFKIIFEIKGLKATYFGNFRTSDRAWFALLDYAKKNDYKLENKPLEHYLNNPFNGGNELNWKTEIIIPFAKNK